MAHREREAKNGGGARWVRRAVLGAVCALVVGVYAWSAQSGMMETSGASAENSYYNLLVKGFRAGQLNLKTEAPPGLARLADPYDPAANMEYWSDHGQPLVETSYFKGKLYLYFGITPALALFWPYAALTGHYLSHKDAGVIFFSAGFLVGAGVLLAAWRRYFAAVSPWTILPCLIALGLANFTPMILTHCDVYEAAVSCGYAMTLLALAAIWMALHHPGRRGAWLAAASLAYGLAVGARPSLLPGAIILLAPAGQAWREHRRVWPLLAAATVPIALIGLGLMAYNDLRFGSPFQFGQSYLLSETRQNTMQQFRPRYLWFNFRLCFLEPARWSGHFPFVDDIVAPTPPKGAGTPQHAFGVLTNIPLVLLGLAAPLAWRNRSAEARMTLRWFAGAVAALFGACALTIGLYFTICLRYEVEFAHALVLLAILGILSLERSLAGQPMRQRAARCGWGLLLAFSVAFNLVASLELQGDSRNMRGLVLFRNGDTEGAVAQFQKALEIKPDYAEAHNNLGLALFRQARVGEAIAEYEKALALQPGLAKARNNLGEALLRKGDFDGAMACFEKTTPMSHDPLTRWNSLGNGFLQKGDLDEAIACYQQATRINPRQADVWANLGLAYSQHKESKAAKEAWLQALEIAPDQPGVENNLAWLLATTEDASLRDGAQAVALAAQASRAGGGGDPLVLRTLAAAYAEEGSYAMAAVTARRALELAAVQKNDALGEALQREIKLYEADRPVREEPP